MTRPVLGSSRLPVFDLAVRISMLIRNLRLPKRCDLLIRQVTGRDDSTGPPLESRVLPAQLRSSATCAARSKKRAQKALLRLSF